MGNNRQEILIQYAVVGYTTSQIAEISGYSEEHVRRLLRSPAIKAEVEKRREASFDRFVKEHIESLSGAALKVFEDVLSSPTAKEPIKVQAAQFILDHVVGKPKASVEVKSSSLAQFMEQIEKLQSTSQSVQKKSKFDDIANDLIPIDFVVGQRK